MCIRDRPSEGEEPPKENRSLFDAEPETGGPEEGEPVEPELTFEPEQVIPSGGPDLERKPYQMCIRDRRRPVRQDGVRGCRTGPGHLPSGPELHH